MRWFNFGTPVRIYEKRTIVETGASYSPDSTDYYIIFKSTGDVTLSLPEASTMEGKIFFVKNMQANGDDVIIDPYGSETIDGFLTRVLNNSGNRARAAAIILSDGTEWYVMAGSGANN